MPWVITKRGSMALPSTYASFASITYPPLEPTGRKTTTPHDWATWFPPQGARGTQYLMDLFNYKGPGFQHDDRHFAGVGRGLGANVRAYNDEHGALPGRLASLSDDFYCAVGFRHDAHRFRDIATPPFVPATLNDYEHLARSAYFDAFEYAVAKVLTAATAHHPLEREGAKWHEMLAEAVAEGQIKRDEAAAIVMLCKMMAVVDQAEIVCTARSFLERYIRTSLLSAEHAERDRTPLADIAPARSADMVAPDFYLSIGNADWHAPWLAQTQWLREQGAIDDTEWPLPKIGAIFDRYPTQGPGHRAMMAGGNAAYEAFEANNGLTHLALVEIGARAASVNLMERGRARLADSALGEHDRAGLALLIGAMERGLADPLTQAHRRMQVSMAAMIGDEAIMPIDYEDDIASRAAEAAKAKAAKP
ncbi:hypothetical protein LJR230_003317 [Trinickia sp. LjRoot230]|uniref:hypothetical protein n=1 Tax=Trinickia sp. LjRoot230 TaxID=3342288 RepID=UPI003ECE700E